MVDHIVYLCHFHGDNQASFLYLALEYFDIPMRHASEFDSVCMLYVRI